jgi:hypothetical protein
MRDLFVIIGSLLIAAVLAAFAVPRFIDWTPYKGEIERRVAAATGLDLKLLGPVKLEFLPRLRLDAQDVTLDTADASFSAAHVALELAPASLLGGAPHIVAAELDDGVIKLAPRLTDDPAASLIGLLSQGGGAPEIDEMRLHTVAIMRLGDASPMATVERGEASLATPGGPLRLTADGRLGGLAGRARLAVGAPEGDAHRHVALAFDTDGKTPATSWRLTFEGATAKGTASPVALDGAFSLTQGGGTAQGGAAGDNKDTALWRVQAKAHGELRAVRFDEAEISRERAAALRLNGKGTLDLAGPPRLTLDLSARRLVLDPLVAAPLPGQSAATPRLGQALAALASSLTAAQPAALTVAFDIGAESVELADESFERFRLKGTSSADKLVLSSLAGNWVGRGEVKFSGEGIPSRGEMRGHVEAKAADATAFAQGLGLAGEAANAHIPLTLAGDVSFVPEATRLEALDLSLSGSRITGSLTLTRAQGDQEARVDADLASRDLDLDAWPLGAVTSIIPSTLAGRLRAHVERLRAGRGAGDVGRLDISLSRGHGEIAIDELKLQGYDGLALTGSGSIGGAQSSFEARILAPKAAPLAALARLVLPQNVVEAISARSGAIEPLVLTLTARRDAASPNIDAALSGAVAASRLDAKGSLDALLAPIAGEATLSAPEARNLLAQLGLAVGAGEPLGRGEAKIALKPGEAGRIAATVSFTAGDSKLTGDGMVSLGDAAQGSGGFSATMPNLGLAARLLGYAPRLEGDPRFEIAGGWTLSPDGLALERLNMRFLGKALTGRLVFALGPERRLSGEIRAPVISVPALVALALGPIRVPSGQGPSSASSSGSSWTSARLPAYVAPPLPVSLDISAPFADLGLPIGARDGRLTLELGERGMALTGASATLAGGVLGAEWRIDRDGGLGRSVLRLTADGFALKDLLPSAGISGGLAGRLELAGAGESVAQILASSGGGGTLRIADGTLPEADITGLRRGFVKAVADDNLMDKQRLGALVAAETARGPLKGLRFEAPLTAASGAVKATISPLALGSGDGAEGTVILDLKALALDARLGLSTLSAGLPETRVPLASSILWRGPLSGPKREVDATALLQAVSIERLRIELEQIELLEFDQREQAMFNRRLKAFRQKALPLPGEPSPASPAPQPEAVPPKANAEKPGPAASPPQADPAPRAGPALAPSPSPIVFAPSGGAGSPLPSPDSAGAPDNGRAAPPPP